MASPSILRQAAQRELPICTGHFRATGTQIRITKRYIGLKYLAKVEEAKKQWGGWAKEIREGKRKSMLSILEERGYVHQVAGERDELDRLMIDKRVGVYLGVDPTAASLHVGHLIPFMALSWMFLHGFRAVSVLGGATAKVGDPTGRLTAREKEHSSIRTANMVGMHYQLKRLWANVEIVGKKYGYELEWAWRRELCNNNMWLNKLTLMEFLQIMAGHARIGPMLGRDTVKNRLAGEGMSFAEFSYPLLQAWDWWHVYDTKDVQLQIGGADQFGNITAGINLVKAIAQYHPKPETREKHAAPNTTPMGFTVPLLETASGEKFGKSAGNAVWLDKEMTSVFDLYGFWIRQSDADMPRFLRLFTFIPIEEIDALVKEHMEDPSQRKAQHKLAYDVCQFVHGQQEATIAEKQHRALFSKGSCGLLLESLRQDGARQLETTTSSGNLKSLNELQQMNVKLPRSLILHKSPGRILWAAGFANSASEGHRLVAQGGAYIGGAPGQMKSMDPGELKFTPVKNWVIGDTAKFLIDGTILILRKGKHNIKVVEVVSDAEWKALGQKYPGEQDSSPELPRLSEREEKRKKEDKKTGTQRDEKGFASHKPWDRFAVE